MHYQAPPKSSIFSNTSSICESCEINQMHERFPLLPFFTHAPYCALLLKYYILTTRSQNSTLIFLPMNCLLAIVLNKWCSIIYISLSNNSHLWTSLSLFAVTWRKHSILLATLNSFTNLIPWISPCSYGNWHLHTSHSFFYFSSSSSLLLLPPILQDGLTPLMIC